MPPTEELFPGGTWERPWIAAGGAAELEISYEAGGAHATIEGEGEVQVSLDGAAASSLVVDGPSLYPLAEHTHHEAHTLHLRPSSGLRVWSVSFAAGVP
jgi:hypothetical protein